jgi:MATE family multidrug resistance protein
MQGIWSGMIGGTLMQTLILLWVTFRTDWNKEVNMGFSSIVIVDRTVTPGFGNLQ